jgi:hypothetical protein
LSGLYKKALIARSEDEQLSTLTDDGVIQFEEGSGISKEDQKEILSQINKAATESKISVSPEVFNIKAIKSGILFPLLVDIFAIIILAAGIFGFFLLFQQQEIQDIQSTEAGGEALLLLEELQKQAERDLLEKDQQLQDIQQNLEMIDKEREELLQNIDEKVREKEEELRIQLEEELRIKKEELESLGLSEEDIELQLRELELEKSESFNQELDKFKKEKEEEIEQYEESIKKLEQDIASIDQEKQKILEEAQKEEDRLRKELEQEKTEVEEELLKAEEELTRLAELNEKEELANSQLIGFYQTVDNQIQSEDFTGALNTLDNISNYLKEESVIKLPNLGKRRNVEFFIINSLENLVELEMEKEEIDTESLISAANLLTEIRNTIIDADKELALGNTDEAEKMYNDALNKLPEINRTHQYFITRLEEEEAFRKNQMTTYLSMANNNYNSGNYSAALEDYVKALDYLPVNSSEIEKIIYQIKESGYVIGLEKIKNEQTELSKTQLDNADNLYQNGQYDEALAAYFSIIKNYPNSEQIQLALTGITNTIEVKELEFSISYQEQHTGQEEQLIILEEQIAALEDSLQSQVDQIQILEQEKANLYHENQNLITQIEELKKQMEELKDSQVTVYPEDQPGDLSDLPEDELERLKFLEDEFDLLKSIYSDYTDKEDSILLEKGESGLIESRVEYSKFLKSNIISSYFPDIYERVRMYEQAFEKEALYYALYVYDELSYLESYEERLQFIEDEMDSYESLESYVEFLQELKGIIQYLE